MHDDSRVGSGDNVVDRGEAFDTVDISDGDGAAGDHAVDDRHVLELRGLAVVVASDDDGRRVGRVRIPAARDRAARQIDGKQRPRSTRGDPLPRHVQETRDDDVGDDDRDDVEPGDGVSADYDALRCDAVDFDRAVARAGP